MVASQPERDLTSTLHLGLRQVVETSPDLSKNLELLSDDDRKILALLGPKTAMLIVHRGPSKGSRFLVGADGVTIGRSIESEVFLDDVTVSRHHAHISLKDSIFIVQDAGSLNGTYVNNASVKESSLATGDEIQIGKFHMLYFGGK